MPKNSTKAEFNSLIKGIITEASPINFPAEASIDEQNFIINKDGTRQRRLGLDLEDNYDWVSIGGITKIPVTYVWESVNNQPNLNFLVVQRFKNLPPGPPPAYQCSLHFFDLAETNLSQDGYLGSLNVVSMASRGSFEGLSFSSLEGALIIAGGGSSIGIITYDGTTFTLDAQRIQVRDTWGVEET